MCISPVNVQTILDNKAVFLAGVITTAYQLTCACAKVIGAVGDLACRCSSCRCKSDMGPPAIWGPLYPHIPSDVRPREVRVSSALGPPSDMDPPPFIWTIMHI